MATVYTKSDVTHQSYNEPGTTESSIGPQIRTDHYQKKALIELKKEQFFGQLADTTSMPKHMGKTIKRFHYLPLLDDANINDQGIDAEGLIANGTDSEYIATVRATPAGVVQSTNGMTDLFFTSSHAVAATATTAAELAAADYFYDVLGLGTNNTDSTAAAVTAGWHVTGADGDLAAITPVPDSGNLYGSSKDPGVITAKLPALSEHGGRVNRVGFKRVELEGTLEKFGFFDEYTQESLDFDTDADLMMHINREMLRGANEITEDALQIDLLNSAGVIRYGGNATSRLTLEAETTTEGDEITYDDLMRLSIDLDNNRCPKNTKIITGSRMVDTRVIDAARYMYVGTELIPTLRGMVDNHGNPALILTQQYGSAGTLAVGELGSIDQFRIIVVPEMMSYPGAGGTATTNPDGYYTTGGKYDVFPMLVVGSESFTTIGFQTDGKTVKFKITHKKPGKEIANRDDPYGEIGFMSIKWYYGFMVLRSERIARCETLALM